MFNKNKKKISFNYLNKPTNVNLKKKKKFLL